MYPVLMNPARSCDLGTQNFEEVILMFFQKTKKALCTAAALVIGVSAINFTPDILTPVQADAAFEQNAEQLVEDIGFGWNLGNLLDSYVGTTFGCQDVSSETSWGNPKATQTLIDGVKSSGVNAIRVPVTWYNHMDPNTYVIDDAWMDRVEEVINYVLDDDMYCILNVHHDTGEKGWLRASSTNIDQNKVIFKKIWEQISERFNSYGDKLVFEGFNEILDDNNEWVNPNQESLNIVNDLNQIFVDTVRASGGNNAKRNLICNTYAAMGTSYVTSNLKIPNDSVSERIIAECHVYQPMSFCFEEYPEVTTWENSKMYLDEQLNAIYNNFVKKGTPAIIGEFGCATTKDNMDEVISWAKYYVETCTNYGIPCIYWDNGSGFKLFNRTTGNVTQADLLGTMLAAANGSTYIADDTLYGDANNDGSFNISDIELLQKWILKKDNAKLSNYKAADFNGDEKINVIDLTMMKQSFAKKDNMCASEDNWSSWVDTTNGASAEVTYNGSSVSIDVKNGGSNPWEAQIAYRNIKLEQGATYRLEFDYVATAEVSSDCNVMQNHDDYLPYHTVDLDYATTVQHMESEFTMTSATDSNSEIAFNCGGKNMIPCKITISNLSLVKLSGSSSGEQETENPSKEDPTEPTTDPDADNTNLCADAANWGGWVNEENGAAATITKNSNGISIDVTNSGEEEWYIQGTYANLKLEGNSTYRIEFDYSADKAIDLGFHVQQNYDPYGQYLYQTLSYNESTQHFSGEFDMTTAEDDAVVVFSCGAAGSSVPFTVNISNLSIVKIN